MKDFDSLHAKAINLVSVYKKTEAALLEVLQQIDETKGYRSMGHTSLFDYCVKSLGLSESVSLNFIAVSRKAVEVPELKQAIDSGELTVSKARKITAVITAATQEDWISKAQNLSSRELEKEVAKVNPQAAMPEKAKHIQEDRLSLSITVSEELYKELKRAQDLECQRTSRVVSLEESIAALVSLYREKRDPLKKAERARMKHETAAQESAGEEGAGEERAGEEGAGEERAGEERAKQVKNQASEDNGALSKSCNGISRQVRPKLYVTGHIDQPGDLRPTIPKIEKLRRKPTPAMTKHQLVLRDEGRCAIQGCGNTRWLQIHHKQPVSAGGDNSLENLVTLCRVHHEMTHELQ